MDQKNQSEFQVARNEKNKGRRGLKESHFLPCWYHVVPSNVWWPYSPNTNHRRSSLCSSTLATRGLKIMAGKTCFRIIMVLFVHLLILYVTRYPLLPHLLHTLCPSDTTYEAQQEDGSQKEGPCSKKEWPIYRNKTSIRFFAHVHEKKNVHCK